MRAAVVYGRFNPPTIGHSLVFSKLNEMAQQGYDAFVFTSQKQNGPAEFKRASKKETVTEMAEILRNPLSWQKKVEFLSKLYAERYPDITISVDAGIKTTDDMLESLYNEGYRDVIIVAGGDRLEDRQGFQNLLDRFLVAHPDHQFDSTGVISAGDRDDSTEASGMSATQLRIYALEDDFDSFEAGIDTDDELLAMEIFDAVKEGLGTN